MNGVVPVEPVAHQAGQVGGHRRLFAQGDLVLYDGVDGRVQGRLGNGRLDLFVVGKDQCDPFIVR
jgi:hypothetical protein